MTYYFSEDQESGNQRRMHRRLCRKYGNGSRLSGRMTTGPDIPIRRNSRRGKHDVAIADDKEFFDYMLENGLHYWDLED